MDGNMVQNMSKVIKQKVKDFISFLNTFLLYFVYKIFS